jgi:hypothetical protein
MKTTGYKESLNQYQDLVNQPTFADYLGNAFSKVGSQPAVGEAQRMSNAMLSGMGAGISGAAAEERRQKLSPMLEQAGRITAKAAELEAQVQEAEQNKFKMTKFMKQAAVPIAQLSQASLAGDKPASNELAKGIYLNFKQIAEDHTMGDFDHYHNGVIYYHNLETGAIEGENVIGLMYQAGIDPISIWGQDAPMIEAGLSPGAKKNYEDSEKMSQMEMEGKRADVDLKKAHAGVYQQQANQMQNEIANPEKPYNKELASHNLTYIKEQRERYINNQALVATLNDLEGFINEANKQGQAGSDIGSIMSRAKSKYWSGDNKNATLADMAKAAYFARVKEAGGSNPSTTEFTTVLETVPNVDKNPEAALKRLEFDREQALKQMYRYKKTEQGIRNSNYQGSPDDEAIFKHDDEEFKTFSKDYKPNDSSETISLFDPTTNEYYDVPTKEAEALHNKYPHLVRQ